MFYTLPDTTLATPLNNCLVVSNMAKLNPIL